MSSEFFYANLPRFLSHGRPCVVVTQVEVVGSTPAPQGARMIVGDRGLLWGTVGGGKIEAAAIEKAQEMLESGDPLNDFVEWNLQRDIGMTCGGAVKLYFEILGQSAWQIAIFGAGHITQALIPVIAPLGAQISVFDTRAEWISRIPAAPNITAITTPDLPSVVAGLDGGSFVLCMTQGHSTDRPILQRALADHDFPYVGVIGSKAKAGVLRRELMENGLPESQATFHCPIGLKIGSNAPEEIAISIAAQLLEKRDEV